MNCHVAVISARRPGNVPAMETALDGFQPVWYVPEGETAAYRAAGALWVVEAGTLVASRNQALDDADGRLCFEVSDDLRKLQITDGTTTRPATFAEVAAVMRRGLDQTGARLAGVAPTANPYFYQHPLKDWGFIVGDLIAVEAGCPLRFDDQLRLKEDYDYTILHLEVYDAVARCDEILATFRHRDNAGGAVAYRTPAAEQEAISYLKAKWPGWLRDNPKRPNEILLARRRRKATPGRFS